MSKYFSFPKTKKDSKSSRLYKSKATNVKSSKDVAEDCASSAYSYIEEAGKDGNLSLVSRKSGKTVAARGTEKTWTGVTGKAPMLRALALQTFSTVLELVPTRVFSVVGAEVQFNSAVDYSFFVGGGDYLTTFDAYRIDLMQVAIRPAFQVGVAGMGALPTLYTVIDYDDAAGAAASVLMHYANCTITTGEMVVRTFVPHATVFVDGGNAPAPSPWIDATSVNVPHYGIKCVVDAMPAGATVLQEFTVNVRCKVTFRTTR